jgi:hypothetical protein
LVDKTSSTGGYHIYVYLKNQFALDRVYDGGFESLVIPFAMPCPYRHIVMAFSGPAQSCRAYIDGQYVASHACQHPASDTTTPLRIGADQDGVYALTGTLDEVAIYDYELSADRVLSHFQAATRR